MIQNPARSSSINVIVAVAARLIAALRQKPCQARATEKARKENMSAGPVVAATDLIADDAPLLEGDHPLPKRGDEVRVVGGHQHCHPELVDPKEQLEDLPADQWVEIAGR